LPDHWESDHGLDPDDPTGENGAGGDPDRDGSTNREEYDAGTDPKSSASVLRLSVLGLNAEAEILTLGFQAVAGRSYTLQARPLLPSQDWDAVDHVASAATNRAVSLEIPIDGPGRAYRLVTPAQP